MQYKFDLDKGSELIIKRLNDRSYKAYAVGGFVRDSLLKVKTSDIDITTDARPQEVMDIFADYKLVDIGIKY